MTTSGPVKSGKAAWVSSGAPNRNHLDAPRLKVRSGAAYTFLKRHSPVPDGDTVTAAPLQLRVKEAAVGTFHLVLKRTASAPHWADLTWNEKPGVTGSGITVTVTNPTAGQVVEFDVAAHEQLFAGGTKDYGWRLESDNATPLYFYGDDSEYPPQLTCEHYGPAVTPTDLAPAGVISVGKPIVSASANDTTGEDEVAKVRWQLDAASDPVSPDFDSGLLVATALQLDLASTAYAGLAVSASTFHRCMWETQAGVQSDWSDWYEITRTAKPTITPNPPTGGRRLSATVSAAIVAYRIQVLDPDDPTEVLADSGKQPATGTSFGYTPRAKKVQDGITYPVRYYVWDTEDRAASPGDPRYTLLAGTFTPGENAALEAPVLVSATQVNASPIIEATFTISTEPDGGFIVYLDGDSIDTLEAADVHTGGTTYKWQYAGATADVSHTLELRAVDGDDLSVKSNSVSFTPQVDGVWILDVPANRMFILGGRDGISSWRQQSQVGEYTIYGGTTVYVFAGKGGLAGGFTGPMRDRFGLTLEEMQADVEWMQRHLGRPVQLVLGDMSLEVVLKDLTCVPDESHSRTAPRRLVSFEFVQAPED